MCPHLDSWILTCCGICTNLTNCPTALCKRDTTHFIFAVLVLSQSFMSVSRVQGSEGGARPAWFGVTWRPRTHGATRPSRDHFSGPSWLSRAPRTSWDLRPQWLSPSIPVIPAERFKRRAGSSTDVQLRAQSRRRTSSLYLTASSTLVYRTDSQLTSFVHFTITFGCSQDLFCCRVCFEWWKRNLWGFFFCFFVFLQCCTFKVFLVFTSPTVM